MWSDTFRTGTANWHEVVLELMHLARIIVIDTRFVTTKNLKLVSANAVCASAQLNTWVSNVARRILRFREYYRLAAM